MQRRADKAVWRFTLSGMPSQRALGALSAFAYRGESTGIQPPRDFFRGNERGSHGTEIPKGYFQWKKTIRSLDTGPIKPFRTAAIAIDNGTNYSESQSLPKG